MFHARAVLLVALLTFIDRFAAAFFTPGPSTPRHCVVPRMSAAAPAAGAQAPPATAAAAAAARPKREIRIEKVIKSNKGYMATVDVNNFNAATSHRVTVSDELVAQTLAAAGKEDLPIEDYFKAVFKFMIQKGMPLTNTEGMINAGVFPVNLFSVKQLGYFHDDADEGIAAIIKDM